LGLSWRGWLIVLAGVPPGFLSNDCATLRPLLDEVVPGGRSELKIAQHFNATTEAIVGHACRLPDRKISSGALESNTSGACNTALGYYAGWNVSRAYNVISIGSMGGNVNNSAWIGNVCGETARTFSSISTIAVTITTESSASVVGDKGRDQQVTKRQTPAIRAARNPICLFTR